MKNEHFIERFFERAAPIDRGDAEAAYDEDADVTIDAAGRPLVQSLLSEATVSTERSLDTETRKGAEQGSWEARNARANLATSRTLDIETKTVRDRQDAGR